ncbi:MAG TPA: FIST N-terminal domain-containing protein, partial [Pilimelia sp.]|nr:FIST N-terminal domain-containing protein [Pilimelia sp.]
MDTGHRWLGVGHSAERDSYQAGREAARHSLRGSDPALLIVFASNVPDPAAMLAGIDEVYPDVPLIGCSSELLVTVDSAAVHGVVVTALGGSGFTVATGTGSCAGAAQRAGGEAA